MLRTSTGPFRALLAMIPLLPLLTADAGAATGGTSTETAPAVAPAKPETPAKPDGTPPEGYVTQAAYNAARADERRQTEARLAEAVEKAKKYDEQQAANATETERAVKKAADEATTAERARTNGLLIGAEVRAVAAGLAFHNPVAALAMLQTNGSLNGIRVGDDGTVDTAAVKTALEALAAAEPYLVKTDKVTPPAAADVGLGGATGSTHTTREIKPGLDRLREAYKDNKPKP